MRNPLTTSGRAPLLTLALLPDSMAALYGCEAQTVLDAIISTVTTFTVRQRTSPSSREAELVSGLGLHADYAGVSATFSLVGALWRKTACRQAQIPTVSYCRFTKQHPSLQGD